MRSHSRAVMRMETAATRVGLGEDRVQLGCDMIEFNAKA